MPRAVLNFQHYGDWVCHFMQADCKSTIGKTTRYFHFSTEPELRAFVLCCNPDDIADYDLCIRCWGRGSVRVTLTDEQYAKLEG